MHIFEALLQLKKTVLDLFLLLVELLPCIIDLKLLLEVRSGQTIDLLFTVVQLASPHSLLVLELAVLPLEFSIKFTVSLVKDLLLSFQNVKL